MIVALAFVKRFMPDESLRSRWDLSGGLRLDGRKSLICLPTEDGAHEIGGTLYAATWISSPRGAAAWLAFQADVIHRRNPEGGTDYVTSAAFRVGNDLGWYGWNGIAWTLDGPWTDEATISANLATFPIGQIGFQIRLSTTDERVAPVLKAIRLAIRLKPHYEPYDDIIFRSLLRSCRTTIRPIGRIDLAWPGGVEMNFASEAPYQPTSGVAAYDVGDGSLEETADLLTSFDPNTGKIVLAAPVDEGSNVRFYFEHEPQVAAVSTSLDFVEANRTPSVTIRNVKIEDAGCGTADQAINVHNGIGVFVPAPRLCDVAFDIELGSGLEWDMVQLQGQVSRWLADGAKVRSTALDEEFDVRMTAPFSAFGFTDIRGLHRGSLSATILFVVFLERPPVPAYAVKAATFTGPFAELEI